MEAAKVDPMGCIGGHEWIDVMKVLSSASDEMAVGEMIQSSSFNLYDSMTAIELMEPKMDEGMIASACVPIKDRLLNGVLPLKLTPQECVCLMDRLLAVEMLYYDGHSLANTIFSCLYSHPIVLLMLRRIAAETSTDIVADVESRSEIDSPLSEEEISLILKRLSPVTKSEQVIAVILDAFIVSTIKAADVARLIVTGKDVYEEEDFIGQTFGFDLQQDVSSIEIIAKLENAKSMLQAAAAANEISDALAYSLLTRLQFRSEYWTMLEIMRDSPLTPAAWDSFSRAVHSASAYVTTMKGTIMHAASDEVVALTFDPKVNRANSAPCPPRALESYDREKAYTFLIKQLSDFTFLIGIDNCLTVHQLNCYLTYLFDRSPNVVVRSSAATLLWVGEKVIGKFDITKMIIESLLSLGVSQAAIDSELGTLFAGQLGKPIYDIWRMRCMNRVRARREIELLMSDWANVQQESFYVDGKLATDSGVKELATSVTRFGLWTNDFVFSLIETHITLGFELEIYGERELFMLFWYLDFTFGKHIQNFQFIQKNMEHDTLDEAKEALDAAEAAEAAAAQSKKAAGAKKGKKGKAAKPVPEVKSTPSAQSIRDAAILKNRDKTAPILFRQIIIDMHRELARGLCRMLGALEALGLYKFPVPPYGPASMRFEMRFGPYGHFQVPYPISYEEFLANSSFKEYDPKLVLESAQDNFKKAKTYVEKYLHKDESLAGAVSESEKVSLLSLAKVAVSNNMEIMKLSKLLPALKETAADELVAKKNPTMVFKIHKMFPHVKFD